jgi:hypothetical protein
MEKTLQENDHKTGWKDLSFQHLLERLRQELAELESAIIWGEDNAKQECTDIANFAMMIFDNLK